MTVPPVLRRSSGNLGVRQLDPFNSILYSMITTETSPRIYVGTFAKYNSGSIAGQWVDLDQFTCTDDFLAHCRDIHKNESDPEMMFQDFEGFPRAFYGESSLHPMIWEWLSADEQERRIFDRYCEAIGSLPDSVQDAVDAFHGCYESPEAYVEEVIRDMGIEIPSWLLVDTQGTWHCNLRHDFAYHHDSEGLWLFNH